MKPLIITNHGLEQYASRTTRNPMACVAELINSIRNSQEIDYADLGEHGFHVSRKFKGDTYRMWYDSKVDDCLLAIVANDGAVKTVLRREMYSYRVNGKTRADTKGGRYKYGHESKKRKRVR